MVHVRGTKNDTNWSYVMITFRVMLRFGGQQCYSKPWHPENEPAETGQLVSVR